MGQIKFKKGTQSDFNKIPNKDRLKRVVNIYIDEETNEVYYVLEDENKIEATELFYSLFRGLR